MTEADCVHSTPPTNSSASNVITFPGRNPAPLGNPSFELPPENIAEAPVTWLCRRRRSEPQTETGKNAKLRAARRQAWWNAERQVEYWKACMNMHSAIGSVQRAGLPEGENHQKVEYWHHAPIVDNYRKAVARLFLTPAPTLLNVTWKKKALAAEKHKFTDVSADKIEAAIAQDLEFLAAHPTRRKREERSA
ncbi:hypothetical protein ACFQZO_23490 [Bradyrhizobium sp. GCM10027634]|uniref:hypothetical protein n=1 Tax=unclassified Bradyrhizobium TaxID=2631580 RepID=UPI00263B50C4|nr:hypothetical protein [Bradyrhizobium sp. WYCCWR 12677]MDN5003804.1 hypothetical protein [Bradyrhizobium sp. WYCCWR 12677]